MASTMDSSELIDLTMDTPPFLDDIDTAQDSEQKAAPSPDLNTPLVVSQSPGLLDDPMGSVGETQGDSAGEVAYRKRFKIRRLLARAHRSAEPFLVDPARYCVLNDIAVEFAKTIISARDLQDICRNSRYRSLLNPEKPGLFRSSSASAILEQARINLASNPLIQPASGHSNLLRLPAEPIPPFVSGALNSSSLGPSPAPETEKKPFNFNSPITLLREAPEPVGTNRQTSNWKRTVEEAGPYLATVQIRPKHEAMRIAKKAYDPPGSDPQSKPFIVWTDGSASMEAGVPMAAAVAYQRPMMGYLSDWVVRAFGIDAHPGGILPAESIGLEKGLEIAIREWDTLNWDYRASLASGNDDDDDEGYYDEAVGEVVFDDYEGPLETEDSSAYINPALSQDTAEGNGPSIDEPREDAQPMIIDLTQDGDSASDSGQQEESRPVVDSSETPQPFNEVHVYTDSQDALNRLSSLGDREMSHLQQEIFSRILGLMEELAEKGVAVRFHWVPGHEGIEGNEKADAGCRIARKLIRSRYEGGPKIWEIEVDINDPQMRTSISGSATNNFYKLLRQKAQKHVQEHCRNNSKKDLDEKKKLMRQANKLRRKNKEARRKLVNTAGGSAEMPIIID